MLEVENLLTKKNDKMNELKKISILPLSRYYNIDSIEFEKNNILNPTLNADIPLFIDPLLLKFSKIEIFKNEARKLYEDFFRDLFKNIKIYEKYKNLPQGEKIKKNIIEKLKFKEIKGLCLGYSNKDNKGRGIGKSIAEQIFNQAEFLISKDNDESIFDVIFLLEEGIGPDFISDMTANIIQDVLVKFTEEISIKLKIKTENFGEYRLPKHPFENTYVLFVPLDILSVLPFEKDTKNLLKKFCYFSNSSIIKNSVNLEISNIISESNSKVSKKILNASLRNIIYHDNEIIKDLSKFINSYSDIPSYNFMDDIYGINIKEKFLKETDKNKNIIPKINYNNEIDPIDIVDDIIKSFKNFLDNQNKIKKDLLYNGNIPKREKAWQGFFKTFVYLICKNNNLDITAESETGNGPVDFKISRGSIFKILVELKLSDNTKYLHGLEKQLEFYKKSELNVKKSYYIYINLDNVEKKYIKKIQKLKDSKIKNNLYNTEIVIINGLTCDSASNI